MSISIANKKLEWDWVDLLMRLPLEDCTVEYANGRIENGVKIYHSVGGGWSTPSIVIEHKGSGATYYQYSDYGQKFWLLKAED